MRYRMLGPGNTSLPGGGPVFIYAIPVSPDAAEYRLLCPENLSKDVVRLVLGDKIRVRQFEDCTPGALSAIKDKLSAMISKKLAGYSGAVRSTLLIGITLAALGLISWIFPDPLVLVDEVLFTAGGAVLVVLGLIGYRKTLPVLKAEARQATARLAGLSRAVDPLLTKIYASIRAKEQPYLNAQNGSSGLALDRIELESEWLVKYIDIGRIIKSGAVTTGEVERFMSGFRDTVPVDRIIELEEKAGSLGAGRSPGARRKLKRRRLKQVVKRAAAQCGISESVLAVYCEFYKSARYYFKR